MTELTLIRAVESHDGVLGTSDGPLHVLARGRNQAHSISALWVNGCEPELGSKLQSPEAPQPHAVAYARRLLSLILEAREKHAHQCQYRRGAQRSDRYMGNGVKQVGDGRTSNMVLLNQLERARQKTPRYPLPGASIAPLVKQMNIPQRHAMPSNVDQRQRPP